MKILMIAPAILTSLCCIQKGDRAIAPFESIDISPFYSNKETKVVVTTKRSYLKFELLLQNDKYTNLKIISDTITSPGTYEYKYSNNYTRNQNSVIVRYSLDGSTFVESTSATRNINRAKYRTIENNESFSTTSTILRVKSDMTQSERQIEYSFSGFEGLYVPPYYHKIQLSDFKIKLNDEDKPFFNCAPKIVIKNYNGSFDGVEGPSEYASFELKLIEESDGFTFALAKDYFVDYETLKMCSEELGQTFVKTKHIYLPINEMRNEDKYKCYFQFNEFGIDKDIVLHHFELRSQRNIFGDCSNSKYCIVREQT